MAIKIFVADDHYMVIEGIRSLLQNETSVELIGHAMNASSCMAFLQKQQPEVWQCRTIFFSSNTLVLRYT